MHDLMSIASVSKPPLSANSFVSSASPVAGACIQQWGDVPSRGLRVGWPRCDLVVNSYIVNDVLQVAAPTRRPLLPNSSLLGGPLSPDKWDFGSGRSTQSRIGKPPRSAIRVTRRLWVSLPCRQDDGEILGLPSRSYMYISIYIFILLWLMMWMVLVMMLMVMRS